MTKQLPSRDGCDATASQGMLCNELAAVEMYDQAIHNIHSSRMMADLRLNRDDHAAISESLEQLRGESAIFNPPPFVPWGYFAAAVSRLAAIVGDSGLLAALIHGERQSESLYRRELGNCDLTDSLRFLIGSRLLPQCQRRLRRLTQSTAQATPQPDMRG